MNKELNRRSWLIMTIEIKIQHGDGKTGKFPTGEFEVIHIYIISH